MSTQKLAFSGVICALASICIIFSSLFHVIFPLVFSCLFFYLCARKCGNGCALIAVFVSNIIGFLIGGVGGGEILFSVLLFSPLSVIIYLTRSLNKSPFFMALRALFFAAFAFAVFMLFATVLKDITGFDSDFGMGVYVFAVVWTATITLFGFAMDKGCELIAKRFFKND